MLALWEKIVLILVYFLFIIGAGLLLPGLMKLFMFLGSFPGKAAFIVMLLFIVIFLLIKIFERKPFSHYGFKRFTGKQFLLMLLFILLLMPLAFLGRVIDPGYDLWYAENVGLLTLSGVLFFSLTMPLYVIKEEMIIRALFQNRLRTYGFLWMAFAVSLNFAFAHFFIPGEGLKHVIVWATSVFIGSFFLIVFFELTKNLWLSMLLHLLFNIIISLQIYLHVIQPVYEMIFWIVMLAGALIAIKLKWKEFIHPFKEKMHPLGISEIVFLIIFAIIFPLILIFA
jgi:membrane protease YdiL (CAAX protease family)